MKPKPIRPFLLAATLAIVLSACNMGTSGTGGVAASTAVSQQGQAPTPAAATDVDCGNVYFPVVEGATWSYAGTGAAGPYVQVDTVTDVGTKAFLVETKLTYIAWVDTWSCTADGLAQLFSDGGQWSMVLQGPDDTVRIGTLRESGVTYPLSINTGDSWSQETDFHLTSSSVNGYGRLTSEFHAVGPEEVTVPAGTFQAMRVDLKAALESDAYGPQMTTHYDGTMWLVPMVGRVKMTGVTRVGDSMPEGLVATIEMESYSIP